MRSICNNTLLLNRITSWTIIFILHCLLPALCLWRLVSLGSLYGTLSHFKRNQQETMGRGEVVQSVYSSCSHHAGLMVSAVVTFLHLRQEVLLGWFLPQSQFLYGSGKSILSLASSDLVMHCYSLLVLLTLPTVNHSFSRLSSISLWVYHFFPARNKSQPIKFFLVMSFRIW